MLPELADIAGATPVPAYTRPMRSRLTMALALLLAACGSNVDISTVPELPLTSTADVQDLLASTETPLVINVWASWCVPCRSEAPLLERAAVTASNVRFIGLNVRDDQNGAREFIARSKLTGEFLGSRLRDILAQKEGLEVLDRSERRRDRGLPAECSARPCS